MRSERRRAAIRDTVTELLGRSRALRSLPPERQREISSNTVAVGSAMAEAQRAVVREVDFPDFVRDLIHSTFAGCGEVQRKFRGSVVRSGAHCPPGAVLS